MMIKKLLIIVVLVSLGSPLLADITGISGTVLDGESVVIAGSGFGTKSPAAPLLWDKFEGGSNGSALTTDPNWTKYNGVDAPVGALYSNAQSYSGSLSASNVMNPDYEFNTNNFFFADSEECYYSYYQRWGTTGTITGGILKYGRSVGDDNSYNGAGVFMFSSGILPSGGSSFFAADADGSASYIDLIEGAGNDSTIEATLSANTWHRVEMFDKLSTAGSANGVNWSTVDCSVIVNTTDSINRASGQTFQKTGIILGLMCANVAGSGSVDMYVDDVYVDNTRARVELGNNSNFASCTHREIQIPSAWASGEITITVNQGTFESNDVVYLFVIESDGSVTNGYGPIVIGQSGGGVPRTYNSGASAMSFNAGGAAMIYRSAE